MACALAVAVLLAGFVVFLWPTPYYYRNQKLSGRTRDYLIRINRITQEVRKLDDTGQWIPIADPASPTYKPRETAPLPSDELAKLRFQPVKLGGSIGRQFWHLRYRLYNGTDKPVGRIEVVLKVNDEVYKQKWERLHVEPGSWCEGYYDLSNHATVPEGATWRASLTAAWWEEP